MLTEQELAKKLLGLLGENGEHWTQHQGAADSHGWPVQPDAKEARKWCLAVAMCKLGLRRKGHSKVLLDILGQYPYSTPCPIQAIVSFNDSHGWKDIGPKLKRAAYGA